MNSCCLSSEGLFYFFFSLSFLCYKIAGITGKHIINLFLCPFGHRYRFADVSKMIRNRLPCMVAGLLKFLEWCEHIFFFMA